MPIKVFDFFSGCGGTSKGFQNAGMDIIFAIDTDHDASETYKKNFPSVEFLQQDITQLKTNYLKPFVEACNGSPLLFCGCAPCQPFTKQNTAKPKKDKRKTLLNEFGRFVEYYKPEYVFVENVPGLQKIQNKKSPFARFIKNLEDMGYFFDNGIVASQSYGVPQKRRRLVILASRLGDVELPPATYGPETDNKEYSSVRDWISDLPAINAGEENSDIPNHRAAKLSDKNIERIQSTSEGGGRESWPPHLHLDCHKDGYTGHTDVYGRMHWDKPASGLTTRCISLSNGRFGHPEQDRAISAREAACLQTFPKDFEFLGSLNSIARQIGNAVPVLMVEIFGKHIVNHMRHYFMGSV